MCRALALIGSDRPVGAVREGQPYARTINLLLAYERSFFLRKQFTDSLEVTNERIPEESREEEPNCLGDPEPEGM